MAEEYIGVKFKVLFRGSKFGETNVRKELVRAAKRVCRFGIKDMRTGNLSIRAKSGGENDFVITPTGVDKSKLEAEDLVLVTGFNERANMVEAVGTRQPSSESLMHLLVYYGFPKVGAIIHAHIPSLLEHADKFETTEEAHPYGTKGLAKEAVRALEKSDLVVLRGHGVIAIGKDLNDCLDTIEKAMASLK